MGCLFYNGQRLSFGGSLFFIPDVDEISLDSPSVLSLATSSNHGIQAIITPSKTVTFTEMSIYSSRKQTGSSDAGANASRTAVCYVGECDEVAPGSHITIMEPDTAVIFDNESQTWKTPTDGERIYGVPTTINGESYYKYTSKLANGDNITLQAGKHYLIGLTVYPYMSTEKIAAYAYETTNKIGYIDIDLQGSKWGEGTDVSSSYENLYPRLDFDGVPFKYFSLTEKPISFDDYTISVAGNGEMSAIFSDTSISNRKRVAYLMRHSERYESGDITPKGKRYAERVGNKFAAIASLTDADCVWYGTTTQRTLDTANNFRKGLFGLATAEEVAVADDLLKVDFDSTGTNFNKYSWPTCASYSSDSSNAEYIESVAKSLIEICFNHLNGKKFGLFVSHDFNTLPMVTWAGGFTNECTFDFDKKNEWLCPMAGVAMIIDDSAKTIFVKPIYSIDAWLNDDDDTYIEFAEGDSGYHGRLTQGYEPIIQKPSHT